MNLIRGKEKFWAALISGGFVAAVSTIARYLASTAGMVEPPEPAMIAGAIDGLVASFAAAFGAYIATNSEPTNISVPATPDPAPIEEGTPA